MLEITPFGRHNHLRNFNPFLMMEELEKSFWNNNSLGEFKTNIKENDSSFILEADLPGFEKKDIAINIENGLLTISGERHSEAEEKDKQGNYIRCERSYGSFSRSFDVSNIKTDDIKAAYENGVLKLTLPKMEETKPAARQLEIE